MRSALNLLLAAGLACAGAGCHKQPAQPQDQNIALQDGNIPAGADIETLPPDESSGTSSNELESGDDSPDVNDVNESGNAL